MPTVAHFQVIHEASALTSSSDDIWVIANAALCRTTRDVVLHAITFKHLHVAAIHLHRNRNNQLPLGILQNPPHRRFEIEIVCCPVELLFSDFERIEFFLERLLGRHAIRSLQKVWDSESGGNPKVCGNMFQGLELPDRPAVSNRPSKLPRPEGTGKQRRNSMFNNLIESSSHAKEFKRRGSFLLFTTATYLVLFVVTGVVSIYAYDAHLETQNTELEITFVPLLDAEPEPQPVQKHNSPSVELRHELLLDRSRTELIDSVSNPNNVPDEHRN